MNSRLLKVSAAIAVGLTASIAFSTASAQTAQQLDAITNAQGPAIRQALDDSFVDLLLRGQARIATDRGGQACRDRLLFGALFRFGSCNTGTDAACARRVTADSLRRQLFLTLDGIFVMNSVNDAGLAPLAARLAFQGAALTRLGLNLATPFSGAPIRVQIEASCNINDAPPGFSPAALSVVFAPTREAVSNNLFVAALNLNDRIQANPDRTRICAPGAGPSSGRPYANPCQSLLGDLGIPGDDGPIIDPNDPFRP